MLLRSTISSTKRFFKTTIQNFKSFLTGGYERLPKNPHFNQFSHGGAIADLKTCPSLGELDTFYTDFTNQWEQAQTKGKLKNTECLPKDLANGGRDSTREEKETAPKQVKAKEEGRFLVMQRLKELESMDTGNVDHVLDIEEVLHYYSRLTSPAYLEIVDRFFMQMYSEFFQSSKAMHRDHGKNPSG